MRPDKPGCWWWEDYEGHKHVVEFNDDMKSIFAWWQMNPLEMEELSDFKCWIDKACPPKKVKIRKCYEWIKNHFGQPDLRKVSVVEYKDIEEFIIKGDVDDMHKM